MIPSFKNYLVEEERLVYFTFGRMNPPTIGHEKLLNKLAANARGSFPYRVYLSQSQDPKKNPLDYKAKVKYARKMFPKHARSIMMDKKIKSVFDAMVKLYDEGFRRVVMIVGSDRVNEFDVLLNKYNGKKAKHGFYNFQKIQVISAGERDPDAEGATGMSASKMRAAASEKDFSSFAQGLPKSISNPDAKGIYNAVRKGMGLNEQKEFKNHVQLEPVSDLREAYVSNGLYEVGEEVVIRDKGIVGKINVLGSNYLIVESKGEKWRVWLDAVEKVNPNYDYFGIMPNNEVQKTNEEMEYDFGTPESTRILKKQTPGQNEWHYDSGTNAASKYSKKITPGQNEASQDPDIEDRPGAQPAGYHTGLKKSTKIARDRQFKRQAKMADDDPKAYKPAPGDKSAKTKLSRHTKKFRQMFGDD